MAPAPGPRRLTGAPYLRVVWRDPVTGCAGYAVIDRLIAELAGGGIRMRPGVTLDEVERLAHTMTLKKGAAMTPGGGAKGGVDFDPHDAAAEGVLRRYLAAMSPLLTTIWGTAEDLGVSQGLLNRLFSELGLGLTVQATLNRSPDPAAGADLMRRAMAINVEGVPLGDCVGGYGVAAAALAALRHLGVDPARATASIQGFGSIGGSAARYLARSGVRVLAVADAAGAIVADRGVDVEALIAARNQHGEIDRSRLPAGHEERPGGDWIAAGADVLVPAAVADVIDEANADAVDARLVVEGANIPTTEGGRRRLQERGIPLVPDFIANAGTMAWFNWTAMGLVEADAAAAYAKIRDLMEANVPEVFRIAAERRVTPHEAAVILAERNLDRMEAEMGGAEPGRRALARFPAAGS